MTDRTILVVEDEASIARVMRLYLEREGYQVIVVDRGDAALESVRRSAPDAVVLDIALPGVDGIEVCRRLRAADDWTRCSSSPPATTRSTGWSGWSSARTTT
jgi:DNA-binding response OmpR family regulator